MKRLTSVWLMVAVSMGIVGGVIWYGLMSRTKNPEMTSPQQWDTAKVRRETEIFLFETVAKLDGDAYSDRLEQLVSIRPQARLAVIDILRQASNSSRLTQPISADDEPVSLPIHRACLLLRFGVPDEAIPVLIPFADNTDARIRRTVAYTLAESGHSSALPAVLAAMSDPEDRVVESVWNGLAFPSIERHNDEYQAKLVERLEQLIRSGQRVSMNGHFLCWLTHHDALDAIHRLLRDEQINIADVLEGMSSDNLLLDRELLLEVVSSNTNRPRGSDVTGMLSASLFHLGRHAHPADETLLMSFTKDESPQVALGAAKGLLRWHHLEEFAKKIWQIEIADRTEVMRQIDAVMTVADISRDHQLVECFYGFYGDDAPDWRAALKCLNAMGDLERADVFADASKLFLNTTSADELPGADGIPLVNKKWQALQRRWEQCDTQFNFRLYLYVIKHQSEFRP